jgi:hypothetical protein
MVAGGAAIVLALFAWGGYLHIKENGGLPEYIRGHLLGSISLIVLFSCVILGTGMYLAMRPDSKTNTPEPPVVTKNPNPVPAPQSPSPATNPQLPPEQPQPAPSSAQPTPQTQSCIGSNCVQGPNYGNQTIVNPPDPEKSWQLSVSKCDEWVPAINALGPQQMSVGWFISDSNGARIAQILVACFKRTSWSATEAVLPANPDGVQLGASEDNDKIMLLSKMLESFGLRVSPHHDIRPVFGNELDIIVGHDAVPGKSE